MRKALSVVAALALVAGVANAEPITTLQLVPQAAAMDPVLGPAGPAPVQDGSETLQESGTVYIWALIEPGRVFNSVGFSVHTTGDVEATVDMWADVTTWSYHPLFGWFDALTTTQRWEYASNLTADTAAGDDIVTAFGVATPSKLGGTGDVGIGAVAGVNNGSAFVLGTMTVTGTYGCVYLDFQASALKGGVKGDTANIYGWDASPIVDVDANLGQLADAPFVCIVPEPASLVLIALAGLVIRRR